MATKEPLDVLGDPVRRRILELLATGEHSVGELVDVISAERGLLQPGISKHLAALREADFVTVRIEAQRRLYSINPAPLRETAEWLEQLGAVNHG